jgi:hypothetical protein
MPPTWPCWLADARVAMLLGRRRGLMRNWTRRLGRLTCIVVSTLVGSIVGLLGALLLRSRGKPRLLLDSNGRPLSNSISEKIWVEINGIEQGMCSRIRPIVRCWKKPKRLGTFSWRTS